MIAQAILESGSGNSSLASEPNYNLFGIKGKYKDQGVTFQTLEQDNVGASFQITSEFRKYPSYKESLEDYAKLIKKAFQEMKISTKPLGRIKQSPIRMLQSIFKGVMRQINNTLKN